MPTSTATALRARQRPLRSPLANPGSRNLPDALNPRDDVGNARATNAPAERTVTLAEFHDYLRTNQQPGRPAV